MNDTERVSKRADAVNNRARLLEAALAVFAQHGLDLEVADIAARAQVGVGTLYRHFGNREDLLRAIVTDVVEHASTQIRQAIHPFMEDPRTALQTLVSAGLSVQQQYGSLFRVIRDPRMAKLFDSAQEKVMRAQFLDQAREVVERGIQVGIFREGLDPKLTAAVIFGAFTTVFDSYGMDYPLAEMRQEVSQLLWAMVAKADGKDKIL